MIGRAVAKRVRDMLDKYPVVALTGPRQSGKSSLLKSMFPDWEYVLLEDPDIRDVCHD